MRAAAWLAIAHVVALGFVMVRLGNVSAVSDAAMTLAFLAWNAAPVLIACVVARRTAHAEIRVAMLAFQVGLSLFYASAIYEAFVAHPDAQAGLIFLFLPVYGIAALILIYLVAALVARSRAGARQG